LLLLALVAAGAVVVASGVLDRGDDDGASELRSQVKPDFDIAMRDRDRLFQLERAYLASYADAQEKVADYRRDDREFKAESKRIEEEFADEFDACLRFSAVACPNPEYPDPPEVPSFNKETKNIRAAASDLQNLEAELRARVPDSELTGFHTQMLAAVESLVEEAEHNADVLDEAAEPAEGEGTGALNRGKLRTLRDESALPAIRQMNRQAVDLIRRLDVDPAAYDVQGGRDVDPADHSTLL
jgi:hypothetical protein